jgi:transposase
MPAAAQQRFDRIRHGNLKTARTWPLKESLREMWCCRSVGWAKRFWRRWYY